MAMGVKRPPKESELLCKVFIQKQEVHFRGKDIESVILPLLGLKSIKILIIKGLGI